MENEGEPLKRESHPAMPFKQAQHFVLHLPDGYSFEVKERRLDGKAPVYIRWPSSRKQDPPPPFRKFYTVEPLLQNEIRLLKELYKNRMLINRSRDLAVSESRNLLDDLSDEFSEKMEKLSKEMEILKKDIEEVNRKFTILTSLSNVKREIEKSAEGVECG